MSKEPKSYRIKKNNDYLQMKSEEQIIQKFPYQCPDCEQPISYDQFHLKIGENKIQCPYCKKTYIKVVSDLFGDGETKK